MSGHDDDARHLVELYDQMWAVNSENAARPAHGPDRLTGAHIADAIAAGRRLDKACEDFRRRHYPRAGRVIVGLGMVSVLSPKGRRGRIVFDPKRVVPAHCADWPLCGHQGSECGDAVE